MHEKKGQCEERKAKTLITVFIVLIKTKFMRKNSGIIKRDTRVAAGCSVKYDRGFIHKCQVRAARPEANDLKASQLGNWPGTAWRLAGGESYLVLAGRDEGEPGLMVKCSSDPGSDLTSQGLKEKSHIASDKEASFCSILAFWQ